MKLVTFGIDSERNLILQFPIFIQPYTQQSLILYQIEMVPILINRSEQKRHNLMHILTNREINHI